MTVQSNLQRLITRWTVHALLIVSLLALAIGIGLALRANA